MSTTPTATALALLISFLSGLAAAQSELPQEMTIDLLSEQAYRQGITEQAQILRRAMNAIERGKPAEAALILRQAAKHLRKQTGVAAGAEMARDLRLAANDLVWLADELAGGRAPASETLLANVAVAAITLSRHHRAGAQAAFKERTFRRAGSELEASALNADASLAFSGLPTGPDQPSLDEAMAVATRLSTGGRGKKIRDRFGSAVTGLAIAVARASEDSPWPLRRSIGRLVDVDAEANSVVIETEDGSGPRFHLGPGAMAVGPDGVMPLDGLAPGSEVAVWHETGRNVAERIVGSR